MKIRDLGEDATIERLISHVPTLDLPSTLQGPGSDAAVMHPPQGADLVWTVDCCREGVHFNLDFMPYDSVGWRGLAAGLSDLAGMGAEPLGFLCDVGASPDMEVEDLEKVYQGFKHLVALHDCPLLGGNLSRSDSLVLSISVLGAVPEGRVISRAGAKPGDALWVTGLLGLSLGGYNLLFFPSQEKRSKEPGYKELVERFLYPKPRLKAGQLLAEIGIRTMMDLSDGIAADVPRLAKASGVGVEIDKVSLDVMLDMMTTIYKGELAEDLVYSGGEDYELLFVVPSDLTVPAELGAKQIGRIVEGSGVIVDIGDGEPPMSLSDPKFRHFF